jgi:hypothetical protein
MRFRTGNVPTTVTRGQESKSPYCAIRARISPQVHRLTLSMKMGSGTFGTLPLGRARAAAPGPPILLKRMRSISSLCCAVPAHDRRHQGAIPMAEGVPYYTTRLQHPLTWRNLVSKYMVVGLLVYITHAYNSIIYATVRRILSTGYR